MITQPAATNYFNRSELELIEDALRFTKVCLSGEQVAMFKEMSDLLAKVEQLQVSNYGTKHEH